MFPQEDSQPSQPPRDDTGEASPPQLPHTPEQPQGFAPSTQPAHTFRPQGVQVGPYTEDTYQSFTVQPSQIVSRSAAGQPLGGSDEPAVMSSPTRGQVYGAVPRRKRGCKLLVAIAVVVAVTGLAVGYVFGMYLPNLPANVYRSSLENTGKGIDTLLASAKQNNAAADMGATFNGSLTFKSSSGSFDTTLNGTYDQNSNATMQMDADAMGTKFTANVRSLHANGSSSPDLYFQVNGIKSFLDAQGMSELDSLDGQWIAVDHTLIDTQKAALQRLVPSRQDASADASPTYDQAHDAALKVQAVNKQYLFTTATAKAVLTEEKFIGRELQDTHTYNHYLVGYNKDHLKAYAKALGQALDSSKLNDWSHKVYGKNLSVVLDFSSLVDSIKNAKSGYTFDLWADTGTKIVSKLVFRDPTDNSSMFTLSQGYMGGSVFPMKVVFTGKNDSGDPQNASIGMTLDTLANKVALTFDYAGKSPDGDTTLSGTFNVAASSKPVSVTAPTGAKPITDILNSLGLGGLLSSGDPGTTAPALSGLNTPLTFQQ